MTRSVPTRRSSDLGIDLHTGPFLSHIRTAVPAVAEGIALLYADHKVSAEEPYADFHIALQRPGSLRRWISPQVRFEYDGLLPFQPLPLGQALPMLEWEVGRASWREQVCQDG